MNQKMSQSFINTTLPALQHKFTSYFNDKNCAFMQTIRRTLIVNQCRASINLQLLNVKWDTMKTQILKLKSINTSNVNILLLDSSIINCSNISDFEETISRKINGSVNILVRTNHNNCNKSVENQLCRHYNMPIIDVNLNSDKSVQNLFICAVKYYWFSSVSNRRIV